MTENYANTGITTATKAVNCFTLEQAAEFDRRMGVPPNVEQLIKKKGKDNAARSAGL